MWYDGKETKMTQKLTTIRHRAAFNNEQSPYRIVSYIMLRNDKFKTIQARKTNGLIYVQKNERKANIKQNESSYIYIRRSGLCDNATALHP